MTPPIVRYAAIDHCLGRGASRYFGQGFRRVEHDITGVAADPSTGTMTANARVRYPTDWSVKTITDAPEPHLSTIDTLVIAAQVAEAYLAHAHHLDADQRRRMWLRSMAMRAGAAPQLQLDDIPVTGSVRGTVPSPDGLRSAVTSLALKVGTIQIACEVEHDVADTPAVTPIAWDTIADVLGPAKNRYFGDGYARRSHEITDVEVDVRTSTIQCLMNVHELETGELAGMAAHYEPTLTMVDCVVTMAQLGQALVYSLDGVERSETGTLWMRRLSASCRTPYHPIAHRFVASGAVENRKRIDRGGAEWHLYDLSGLFQGMQVGASVAFTVSEGASA